MALKQEGSPDPALVNLKNLLPELEALYKDVHSHPELSMQETRTAGLAADRLRAAGFEVTTGVGKTGVVGLLRNGDGPTVMLRADMDALPVEEATGLPYANDRDASERVVDAFRGHFGTERVRATGPAPASEDFGSFGTEWHVPSVFWFVGGTDPEIYAKAKAANKLTELPVNHSPKFAPVLHPTLQTGVETLVVATRAWLHA